MKRKVDGDKDEAVLIATSNRVASKLEQSMNNTSTTKSGANTGSIKVTASVDVLADLVAVCLGKDSRVSCKTVVYFCEYCNTKVNTSFSS